MNADFGFAAVRPYSGGRDRGDDYGEDDADDQCLPDPRPVTGDAEAIIVLIVRLVHIPRSSVGFEAPTAPLTLYATKMRLDVAMTRDATSRMIFWKFLQPGCNS